MDNILAEREVEALLLFSESFKEVNMYYLTKFLAPDPFMLLKEVDNDPVIVINSMEYSRAQKESIIKDVRCYDDYNFFEIVKSASTPKLGGLKFIAHVVKKELGVDTNIYIQPRIWPKAGTGRYFAKEFHVVIPVWKFDTLLGKDNPRFEEERRYMISSWRRISSDALPPQVKSWANYANSGLANREAARLGFDGAIFLDSRGFVSEGTGACLMSVYLNISSFASEYSTHFSRDAISIGLSFQRFV